MKQWFESLAPRERLILGLGTAVALCTLYFITIWEPLSKGASNLSGDIQAAAELVSQMEQAGIEASQYSPNTSQNGQSNGRSLLSVVDGSGKRAGLATAIKRIQPEGDATVRVWLEEASFEAYINWLLQLKRQHGVVVSNSVLDRDDEAGTIKVRMSLKRGAS